jgi:cell division protein FtsB
MKRGRMRIKLLVSLIMTFLIVGCGDESVEEKNVLLSKENRKLVKENSFLKSQIIILKDKNKFLNVSLAKSEVDFSKKHQDELAKSREKMLKEFETREANLLARKEKLTQEIEEIISMKYMTIFIVLVLLMLSLIIFIVLNFKKSKEKLEELEEKNSEIIKEKESLHSKINEFQQNITELEYKAKSGIKNQVVSKLDEYKMKRTNQMRDL